MKKLLAVLLVLGLLLTSCGSQSPVSEDKEEVITDPAVLEKFWEDYIDDCPFTLSSSYLSWESPSEIEPLSLCNYLFLKMQRMSDLEDTNFQEVIDGSGTDIKIKADKLISYHDKYFAEPFDYRTIQSSGCYYDSETDSVVLSVGYLLGQLPDIKYNQFEEYPHFSLESLTLYPDSTAVAKVGVNDYRLPSLNEDKKLYHMMKFQVMEDGTYRHISSSIDFAPLEGSGITGAKEALPAMKDLNKFTTTGPVGDILPLFSYRVGGLGFSTYNLKTNSFSDEAVIPMRDEHAESSVILRNGHLLLIETTYDVSEEGSINTKNPHVYLSELYLDGSERRTIEIPENTAYISDISGDLSMMLYKESMEQGFLIYNFETKTKEAIANTAPEIPEVNGEADIFSMESFGHGQFTSDNSMIVLYKFGYEWGAGYTVYDIGTKVSFYYPAVTSWGGYPIMTPNGLYIGGIADEGGSSYRHGFLKFTECGIMDLPATPFPENFQYSYVPNGESQYIAMLMPTNDEEYHNVPQSGLAEMALTVFDSKTLTIKDTWARIMRTPYTQCLIFILDDGSLYIFDPSISQSEAYIVENPFLK